MTEQRPIAKPEPAGAPTDATLAQWRAAKPDASSWVSANAGSGKTRVLTDRVARLLLARTDPRRILCLTYTKAAAAEMQNRLFATLGKWAMLDDDALRAELLKLGEEGPPPSAEELNEARRLFARGLETPGGLKIQTIHAFCDALLRRFPLEAGVAPSFQMLDDRAARALREEVLDTLAGTDPAAVAGMAMYLSGDDPDPLMLEIVQRREDFAAPFDALELARALEAEPGLTADGLRDEVLSEPSVACLREWIAILAPREKNDGKLGAALRAALGLRDAEACLAALEGCLLMKSGANPFTAKAGSIPTKALREAHPALTNALNHLMRKVEAARPRRLALAALARCEALHRFARAFLGLYEKRKRARGLLDFDDLIDRARDLLSRRETAAWVLWRLDGGLDHILVDEAQDTSPRQWQVIKAISDEFFVGLDDRGIERTIFVVGDEKQSIYSFQGADPVAFGEMRRSYDAMLSGMGRELQRCDLLHSFRSAKPVLRLVDEVFAGPGGAGFERVEHRAFREEMPGRVELWPFLPKPARAEEPPWESPEATVAPDDPVAELARRVARRIRGWLDEGKLLPGENRAMRPGDVLILVQRRAELFHAIIRALKIERVPVAGADVLKLEGELAVRDLLALLRVAATPGDDLSLAALLRGPLGGMSEEALFDLAHDRDGSLWAALRAREAGSAIVGLIDDIRGRADYERPFELLERILIRHDGRRRLVARLGHEAEDAIDALLDQALAYETGEAPSLTGFLDWIDREEMKVKRRLEDTADQARVMTVHGSKGLEAPIVILPDTAPRRDGGNPPQLLRLDPAGAAWRARADATPPALERAERERRGLVRAENLRLLYVALTRARSWLIVAGAGQPPKEGDGSWYGLVETALRGLSPEETEDGLTLAKGWEEGVAKAPEPEAEPPAPPDWALRPARIPEEAEAVFLTPSNLGGVHALPFEAEAFAEEGDPLARGEAAHLLLERLRGRARADWPALAARLLPGRDDLPALLAEAEGVLLAPELDFLFGPDTLAEVEIAAPMPEARGRRLIGRIDRLVVGPERVLAVDFKSNRGVPEAPEQVPEGILRQMGAYAAALAPIWPGRRIETAVLWTRSARLMPLPGALTAAALARALAECRA
ncbi:double-strand break repair helicase AddA [Amaricoccus solimangrovi]|uniref:double-strand break repair helicase AddA n=1 Tax=Amaricoccus solimangrovi TaxID=2589815 RepID=UPI001F15910A|nr:double-strand break repair helicase AddA [Amaricoccus solimangrovi]